MRIIPLASICGSTVSCGSITATPTGRDCRGGGRRKSPPAAAVLDLEGGGVPDARCNCRSCWPGRGRARCAPGSAPRCGRSAPASAAWCAAPAAVTAATISRRSTVRPALVLVTTLRSPRASSPREGRAHPAADALVLKARGDAGIEDHELVHSRLRREAQRVLAPEVTPIGRDRKPLVRRQRAAASAIAIAPRTLAPAPAAGPAARSRRWRRGW